MFEKLLTLGGAAEYTKSLARKAGGKMLRVIVRPEEREKPAKEHVKDVLRMFDGD